MPAKPDRALGSKENWLVSRAIKGDAEAFGSLYTHYLEAIYRYIYFRIGDETEAEDLTEEVFVRAWEALPSYQTSEYPFKSWLYRIAHNLVVDHRRKRKPDSLPEAELLAMPSGTTPPEDVIMSRQEAAAVAEAIQYLAEDEQQVVILRFIEGLSHKEISQIIGKSEGASRVVQHRALLKLYRYLVSNRKIADG